MNGSETSRPLSELCQTDHPTDRRRTDRLIEFSLPTTGDRADKVIGGGSTTPKTIKKENKHIKPLVM